GGNSSAYTHVNALTAVDPPFDPLVECPKGFLPIYKNFMWSLQNIFNNMTEFAAEQPDRYTLCFDPSQDLSKVFTSIKWPLVIHNDTRMPLLVHGLTLHLPKKTPIEGPALKIEGKHVIMHALNVEGEPIHQTGLLVEGEETTLADSAIQGVKTGVVLTGSGHTVQNNTFAEVELGILADCAWPEPHEAPSCTIGPGNLFQFPSSFSAQNAIGISIPASGQQVFVSQNASTNASHYVATEEGANGGIVPLDSEWIGKGKDVDLKCPQCFRRVVGRLDPERCEGGYQVEIAGRDTAFHDYICAKWEDWLPNWCDSDYTVLNGPKFGQPCTIRQTGEPVPIYDSKSSGICINGSAEVNVIPAGSCIFECVFDHEVLEDVFYFLLQDQFGNTSASASDHLGIGGCLATIPSGTTDFTAMDTPTEAGEEVDGEGDEIVPVNFSDEPAEDEQKGPTDSQPDGDVSVDDPFASLLPSPVQAAGGCSLILTQGHPAR
ncbi:MAG: hypothetical protein HYV03_08700, partial [Deltaproteobacteria bacterium]|nr:hypothetical protein [Deltaproteobacteria bacterium]